VARNALIARLVAGAPSSSAPARATVLDIGCGRGFTVDYLRGKGVDCHGVELAAVDPLPAVRAFVTASKDAFTLPEDLRRRVTVILLLDVLEHLPAPDSFLEDVVRHFPSLARVVVTVPARRELWSNYDDFYGHLRRYDRASLGALLRPFGTASSGYFFHSLYPVMRAQLAASAQRPVAQRPPRWPWAHAAAARFLDLEQRVLPAAWYGTSLWGVCDR
jgi:SAM-dependent methyltransferase